MITLRWVNTNVPPPSTINIYRSQSPMDPNSLPSPIDSLSGSAVVYVDDDVTLDETYYYRVGFVRGPEATLSSEVEIVAGAGKTPPSAIPPGTYEAGYLYDDRGNLLYTLSGDNVLDDWASTRKFLAAVVVLEEKGDVLDSELVTITNDDINSTGPEFRSGLSDGDQVTWRDIIELMLVPSMSDVAATVTRVLGAELQVKYGVGNTPAQAIGYWMSTAAIRAGARNTITLTNNSSSVSPPPGELLTNNMYTTPHQLARCLQFALQNPFIKEIMQMASVSVNVQGPNPRTITHGTIDRMRAAWDSTGVLTGYEFDGYIAGKTGDSTWGNQVFACEMPSGDTVYGSVYKSTTRDLRVRDIIRVLMCAENHYPHLRSPEVAADPSHADVSFRVQGGSPIVDSGPAGRTITNDGVTTAATDYMTETALEFDGSSTLTIGGSPPNLSDDDFTLEVYLRGGGTTPSTPFILAGQWQAVSGGRGWMVQVESNRIDFFYSTTGDNQQSLFHRIDLDYLLNGSPSHVCVMRSGADLAVYFNGIRSAVHNIGSASIFLPSSPVMIGGRMSSGSGTERHYVGFVDEVILTTGVARYGIAGFRPRYRPHRWDT